MERVVLGILMVFTGLLGLSATACSLFFLFVLPEFIGLILIGFALGALLLWAALAIWKALSSSSPPAEQTPELRLDRKDNP